MSVADGESATPPPPKTPSDRLYFADNLRTFIIVLVVLHHLAIVYGAGAVFYYVEPPYNDRLAFIVLFLFIIINQTWFMGLLFLISGYFSPGSLKRKGPRRFVRDRLIRLGIPLVVFFFVLNPLAYLGIYAMLVSLIHFTTPLSWQAYPKLIGFGPIWFVAMLPIFDIGYAIWWAWAARRNRVPRQERSDEPPRYRVIVAFILLLALASYLIRIVIPLGEYVAGFPTLSYLPQYLSFFVIGTVAVHLVPERSDVDGEGRLCSRACRDNHVLLSHCAQRRHKGCGPWVLAVWSLCAVRLDRCGRHVSRAHHALPRALQLVGQLQPVPAATLVHRLHHPGSDHRIRRRCIDGTLARAPAQVRRGSGHHGSALFRGGTSGAEDPVCVEGALTEKKASAVAHSRASAHSPYHLSRVQEHTRAKTDDTQNPREWRLNQSDEQEPTAREHA